MLLGSSTVQICTGVMLHGVKMIDELKAGLEKFMTDKGFTSVAGDCRQESALLFHSHGSGAAHEGGQTPQGR